MKNSEYPPLHQSSYKKLFLSLGFIVVSILYILFERVSGATSTPATTLAAPNTHSSTTLTPGESYKAANDALLKTLAQIAATTSPTNTSATPPTKKPVATKPKTPTPPAPTPTPVAQTPAGQYTNGSYTGSTADAYYGTVQVQVIIKNGQLADVQFLQYPNDRSNSRYINSQAMPLLTQEALQAQSANVSGVSGATFTSQAFQQSLAAALALAKI